MPNIILIGANGKMGHMISELAGSQIIAGIDKLNTTKSFDYPVYEESKDIPTDILNKAQVIIDFSNVNNINSTINFDETAKKPLIIGTTGLTENNLADIIKLSKEVPVLVSSNMSIGINAIVSDIIPFIKTLGPSFDIEIVEKHHNKKVDAPSGTALLIADSIKEGTGIDYEYVFDRSNKHEARNSNEIGISAVRGGTIPGEHTIILAGNDEVIEIKHTAFSRKIFAEGALRAAKWIADQKPGFYNMQDVLGENE